MGEIATDKSDVFSVVLDMNCFRLSEMSVKLVDGSIVVVEAKHGERPDKEFGSISRHFLHRYRLPSDIDPGSLISDLSDKGILTITAKKKGGSLPTKHTDPEEVLMAVEFYDETLYIIDNYEHPHPDTFYTLTRVPDKSSPDYLFEQFEDGCQCADLNCTIDNNCSCLRTGPNYRCSDGALVLAEDKFGDVPVFECNFRCRCFEGVLRLWGDAPRPDRRPTLCGNRCAQFGPSPDLEIFETSLKGLGLKSTRRIPSGGFICEYAGEVIGLEEAKIRQERSFAAGDMNYIFILTEDFGELKRFVTCVDPSRIGNVGRYINHSCQPNAAVVPVRVNSPMPLLCVFAVRDIEAGEEICFDYSGAGGVAASEVEGRKPCHCSAAQCRRFLPFQVV